MPKHFVNLPNVSNSVVKTIYQNNYRKNNNPTIIVGSADQKKKKKLFKNPQFKIVLKSNNHGETMYYVDLPTGRLWGTLHV